MLEETEGKAIIWANYQLRCKDYKRIIEEYGEDSVVHYYGLTPQEDRQENIKNFKTILSVDLLLAHHKQVVMVLHLQKLILLYIILMDYDLEKRLQSEDRAHRIGQTKSVTYVDMILLKIQLTKK